MEGGVHMEWNSSTLGVFVMIIIVSMYVNAFIVDNKLRDCGKIVSISYSLRMIHDGFL
jgi:hypothetical protein